MADIKAGGGQKVQFDEVQRHIFHLVIDPKGQYANVMKKWRPIMERDLANAKTEDERNQIRKDICSNVFMDHLGELGRKYRIRKQNLRHKRSTG